MVYKIIVSPRAQKEIEEALAYYALHSSQIPQGFIMALKETYQLLAENPFFKIRYKNIRGLKIKRFPYFLYYWIDKKQKTIRVLSCFHHKRDPKKRPKP